MGLDVTLDSLSNGIRLLHSFEDSPVVYCGFAINAGTRDENTNEYGIAHLIEHLLFNGTKKRNNIQIIRRLEEVGGEINAYTTKEETFVYAIVPKKHTKRAVELLADILFNSLFSENQIKKEREIIFEEIDMYRDTPTELIFDDIEDLVFKGSSLGHNILGSKKSLSKISSQNCHNFVKRCYTTDNILFFLQGNISENEFVRIANRHLSFSPTRRDFSRDLPKEYTPKIVTNKKKINQTHCIISTTTVSLADKDVTTLNMLNNILGGTSLTSKLNLAIREKKGLVYSIDSSLNLYSDIGIWNIYFGCSEINYKKCTEIIYNELDKLASRPLSITSLEKYKQQLLGQLLISSQNRENYILTATKMALHLNKPISIEKIHENIQKITTESIYSLANRLFNRQNFTILKYGNVN